MSSPITDEVLSSTLRQYPLANPRIISALEASKLNDNFLVEDAEGRRYVRGAIDGTARRGSVSSSSSAFSRSCVGAGFLPPR